MLRGCGMLKEIIEGRFEGKRSRGRKRIGMLDSLLKGENFEIMKRRTNDRIAWRNWTPGTCMQVDHMTDGWMDGWMAGWMD